MPALNDNVQEVFKPVFPHSGAQCLCPAALTKKMNGAQHGSVPGFFPHGRQIFVKGRLIHFAQHLFPKKCSHGSISPRTAA